MKRDTATIFWEEEENRITAGTPPPKPKPQPSRFQHPGTWSGSKDSALTPRSGK